MSLQSPSFALLTTFDPCRATNSNPYKIYNTTAQQMTPSPWSLNNKNNNNNNTTTLSGMMTSLCTQCSSSSGHHLLRI